MPLRAQIRRNNVEARTTLLLSIVLVDLLMKRSRYENNASLIRVIEFAESDFRCEVSCKNIILDVVARDDIIMIEIFRHRYLLTVSYKR